MPFANLKVPTGSVTSEQMKSMVETVTDMYVGIYGDQARPNVMVLVEEVPEGGWGIGGNILEL